MQLLLGSQLVDVCRVKKTIVTNSILFRPERLEYFVPACKPALKYSCSTSGQILAYLDFPAIPANFGQY